MKTIPSKVIYVKEDFEKLQKEFEEKEIQIKSLTIANEQQKHFFELLNKLFEFEDLDSEITELYLIVDQTSDRKHRIIGRK